MKIPDGAVIHAYASCNVPESAYEYMGEFSFQDIDMFGKEFDVWHDEFRPNKLFCNHAIDWPDGQLKFRVWLVTYKSHKEGLSKKKLEKWLKFMERYKTDD